MKIQDAQKAIPKGTISAISLTSLLYIAVATLSSATVVRDASGLVSDYLSGNLSACLYENSTAVPPCEFGLLNDYQVIQIKKSKVFQLKRNFQLEFEMKI